MVVEKHGNIEGFLLSDDQYQYLLRLVDLLNAINNKFGKNFRFAVNGMITAINSTEEHYGYEFNVHNETVEHALKDLRNSEMFELLLCPDCGEHYVRPPGHDT